MGSARAKGQYTMQTWIIKWFTDKPSLTLGSRCTNIGGIYPGRHVWSLYFPCVGALLSFYFPNHYLGPQSLTEPQLQSRHPYAAMPSLPSLPFAALGAGHQLGKDPAIASELMKNQRPESEAFSRGAGAEGGMKRPYFFGNTGVDTPGGMSGTSPGMGTFGLEGKEVGSKMPTVTFFE